MKLKYYLRGVGIGIIFCAIILAVSHSINKTSEISEADAVKRVKELGYSVERKSESDGTIKGSEDSETADTEPNTESNTEPNTEPNTEANTPDTDNTTESAVFIINTDNNTSWRDAFKTLQGAGVIKDADDLYNYYNDKYERTAYLMNGAHEIPYGSTYDEIIQILSTKRNN